MQTNPLVLVAAKGIVAFCVLVMPVAAFAQTPDEAAQTETPPGAYTRITLPTGKTVEERNAKGFNTIRTQAFSATDWSVSNTLGVGTDTPEQDLEIEKSSFPFLFIESLGATEAGVGFANPANFVGNYSYTHGATGDLLFDTGTAISMGIRHDNGFVGIGVSDPPLSRLQVGPGTVTPVTAGSAVLVEESAASSMILKSTSGAESFFYQDAVNGLFGTASTTPMGIRTNNLNRVWITAGDNVGIGTTSPTAALHVIGNIVASGTKSFAQDDPTDPAKQIVYAALEGGEAGTYTRGTATLVDGKIVVELPEHFRLVTEDSGLTVQLTPRGDWLQLFIVELSPGKLSVREANRRSGQFDFLVQGVRKGYADYRVIRDKVTAN